MCPSHPLRIFPPVQFSSSRMQSASVGAICGERVVVATAQSGDGRPITCANRCIPVEGQATKRWERSPRSSSPVAFVSARGSWHFQLPMFRPSALLGPPLRAKRVRVLIHFPEQEHSVSSLCLTPACALPYPHIRLRLVPPLILGGTWLPNHLAL